MKVVDVSRNIPQVASPAEAWVQWHKDLKSYFGKKGANSAFIKAWSIRGNPSANTSLLREYLGENGITISTSKWDNVVDVGVGALDMAGDMFKVSRYFGIAIGVVLIGGVAMVIFNIAKDPVRVVNSVSGLKKIR